MKKLLKPEMEFIKFNTEDVITTSGGDTYKNFDQNNPENTTGNAHDSQDYSAGQNNLWNKNVTQ